jgi:hypothetical protein
VDRFTHDGGGLEEEGGAEQRGTDVLSLAGALAVKECGTDTDGRREAGSGVSDRYVHQVPCAILVRPSVRDHQA